MIPRPARFLQAVLFGAAVLAGVAAAATPSSVIAKLNAQRQANGLPAQVVENRTWSKACALHDAYLRRTHDFSHLETKGKPGYTPQGLWAAQNSVLSIGRTWASGNPWENAPVHLLQTLTPLLRSTGIDDGKGFSCAITWPGYRFGPKNALYSYPGDGTVGWRTAETAREGPYTAGEGVGIPQGTKTGLIMLVMADGPWAQRAKMRITSAKLVGPHGPVEVRSADNGTPKVGPYLPAGGVVIPVRPLEPNATYKASVKMKGRGATLTRVWSFKTAG
jgi:hypothetical protein